MPQSQSNFDQRISDPLQAQNDQGMVRQHNLKDVIEADKYSRGLEQVEDCTKRKNILKTIFGVQFRHHGR